jgi:hypothetical protein
VTNPVQLWLMALYAVSIVPLFAVVFFYHRKDRAELRASAASK